MGYLDRRIPGVYKSRLSYQGIEPEQPVICVGEEDGGWWFELPDTWPAPDCIGQIRWFDQRGATFIPS